MTASLYLESLKNRIDITRVPFSDRGSHLLVFKEAGAERLYIKLAERLTAIQPGLATYRFCPRTESIENAGPKLARVVEALIRQWA
jgi:hypothetical protein